MGYFFSLVKREGVAEVQEGVTQLPLRLFLFFFSWVVVAFGQPAWLPWLAPGAASVGYAIFWKAATGISSPRSRFWGAVVWYAAVQLVQLSWMTATEFQGIYILGVYCAVAFGLGLPFGGITYLVDKIPLTATAALWVVVEWSRLFFLCGFSWNPAGLCLTSSVISLQTASLFGILGLSFLVFLTNLSFWAKKWGVATTLTLFPYLFGLMQMWYHGSTSEGSMVVGLVQTALSPAQKMRLQGREEEFLSPYDQWRRIVQLIQNSCGPLDRPLDLLVLPEYVVPMAAHDNCYSFAIVKQILQESVGPSILELLPEIDGGAKVSNQFWLQTLGKFFKVDAIAGLETEAGGLHFTSAVFVPYNRPFVENYHKQILVPLAEYIPFEWVRKITARYGITDFFSHGTEAKIFLAQVPMAASICYEETFAHLMRKNRQRGAVLFVNLTNDGWYPHSRLAQQHFDHARLRAVENGVPLIRACNTGVTAAVDSLGRIVGQIGEENKAAMLVAHVPLYHYATLYTIWGDGGVVCLAIFFLLIYGYNRMNLFL